MRKPYTDPTRPSYVFDLETTGLIQGYGPDVRSDVGISQFALRQEGTSRQYSRFTNILQEPVRSYDAGKITAARVDEMLQASGPGGVRWQEGYKSRHNVLHGVFQRHLEATRAGIKGRPNILAKEADLVDKLTRHLEAGHKIKGWNIDFDMLIMNQASARANPALHQRWKVAVNRARNAGLIEDMAVGTKKFMYLAAQESAMAPKGREFFTVGQIDPKVRAQVRQGKLSLKEIDQLSYDKLIEPHKGFGEFFARRLRRRGDPRMSFERYRAWLEGKGLWSESVQSFATGQRYPNIRYMKGWSADVITRTLAPGGIKGSTLEKDVRSILGQATPHEAVSDTVFEEMFEKLFRTRARTWDAAWEEIHPRLKRYDIHSQEQFFQRYRSAIEWKSKSQLSEVAREATRHTDDAWLYALGEKTATNKQLASRIAGASASQPETLRKIYSRAYKEVSGKWTSFRRTHPKTAMLAQGLAAATILDALVPQKQERIEGVRTPYTGREIDGIYFGPASRGVAKALTDFGSGRLSNNAVSYGFNQIMNLRAQRAVHWVNDDITREQKEKAEDTWRSARSSAKYGLFHGYEQMRAGKLGIPGLNRDAWVGMIDLDSYKIKVQDADTIIAQRRGVTGMFRKPVSIRMAGIDAPETQHGPTRSLRAGQFGAEGASELLEDLIERQQSLRLVIDPSARSYNRNVGVLIGDRSENLNLQMVRYGGAGHFESRGRSIVNEQVFAEAEAVAARGGVGMWQSKGWQAHRAMGMIAGERMSANTLTRLKKLADHSSQADWWYLVQSLQESKEPWSQDEMQRMYQTGAAYRTEIMGVTNQQIKEVGYKPGLRQPTSHWHTAGYAIGEQSYGDFGSGRAEVTEPQAEQIADYLQGGPGTAATQTAPASAKAQSAAFRYEARVGGRAEILQKVASVTTNKARQDHTYSRSRPVALPLRASMRRWQGPMPIVQGGIKETSIPNSTSGARSGMNNRAVRHLDVGPAAAAEQVAMSGYSIGTWVDMKGAELRAASTAPYNNPNEFVAMKPFGDFVSSHKAGAWAEHKAMADVHEQRMKHRLAGEIALMGFGGSLLHQRPKFDLSEAWEYFYRAEGERITGPMLNKVKGKLVRAMKGMGYSRADIVQFMRQSKWMKGFKNKIPEGNLSKMKSWLWEAIDKPLDIPGEVFSKTGDAKKIKSGVWKWFKNLTVKPLAKRHQMTADNFVSALKNRSLSELKSRRVQSRFAREMKSAKTLWKHLVTNKKSFQAKFTGAANIIWSFGEPQWGVGAVTGLEKQALVRKAGLLGEVPGEEKTLRNLFTNVGDKLTGYMDRSKVFTSKFPTVSKHISSWGQKITKFGKGGVGKIAGRVPLMDVAFGLLQGYSMMDQYENATKGFAVEATAGAVEMGIMAAAMRPSLFMMAGEGGAYVGGAIGSAIAPGVGTAIGAGLGWVVGCFGSAALAMLGSGIVGSMAGGAVRTAMQGMLGARRRRAPGVADYATPQQLYPAHGFSGTKAAHPNFARFHGIDSPRRDLTPFGGSYNPARGQDIDSRTLELANKKRVSLPKPQIRPSGFTPTAGLVNNVLWSRRQRSRLRDVRGRNSEARKPAPDRNKSRMLHRAA